MKGRILEVVVIACDEDCAGEEGSSHDNRVPCRVAIGKSCVTHDTSGVNHGELIDQLHWVYTDTKLHKLAVSSLRAYLLVAILCCASIVFGMNIHFRVEWKKKLPEPTIRYPMKDTRKTLSWPLRMQLLMPLYARYINIILVKELTISAEYIVA
jgi:hypothetical protein